MGRGGGTRRRRRKENEVDGFKTKDGALSLHVQDGERI